MNKIATTQVFVPVPASRRERTLVVKLNGGTLTLSALLNSTPEEWVVSDIVTEDGAYVIDHHLPFKVTVTGGAVYSLR